MGREIKRVPLDFNWPKDTIYGGYINPFYKQCYKCPSCDGSGSSPEAKRLNNIWYGYAPFKPEDRGSIPWTPQDAPVRVFAERQCERAPNYYGTGERSIHREALRLCELWNGSWSHHLNADDVAALIKATRLHDFNHTWKRGEGWTIKDPPHIPTPREVNAWSLCGFGHDAINGGVCIRAECERLGFKTECEKCSGDACLWPSPEIKQQYDDWASTEPPAGEGYQLWETVSEGSPISPVFATPEELAAWLTTSPDYKWKKNDAGTTYEQWLTFIRGPGWAPSFVSGEGVIKTGVQSL